MLSQQETEILVTNFLSKDILISADFLANPESIKILQSVHDKPELHIPSNMLLFETELVNKQDLRLSDDIDWLELEKAKVLAEKNQNQDLYNKFISFIIEQQGITSINTSVKNAPEVTSVGTNRVFIDYSYDAEPKKREVSDFVSYFNKRYNHLESILRNRIELQGVISINRLLSKKEKETVSIIGLVVDKRTTKNGNTILLLEDSSGEQVNVLISKNRKDLYETSQSIVFDEVIGIVGANSEKIVFANNIIFPDVPLSKELLKSPDEAYAIFLSDIHVGSNNFLPEEFSRFIQWIQGNIGDENQQAIASKIKYVFIAGDLVDGVGIYPGQETELTIPSISEQYKECAKLLSQIPQHIQIIICPGNHDAVRMAEPQPTLYKDFAKPIWDLQNVTMVSNPSTVTIHKMDGFDGFKVLLYHGYSFDYYVANVESIRNNGGYDRADLIMQFMLKRRHLAPTHTSNLYIPDTTEDPLVIKDVPDFFVSGHIHKTSVSHYRNVTMICGSCWQSKTAFQEKVGHNPEPCRVPLVNLQTRKVRILKF